MFVRTCAPEKHDLRKGLRRTTSHSHFTTQYHMFVHPARKISAEGCAGRRHIRISPNDTTCLCVHARPTNTTSAEGCAGRRHIRMSPHDITCLCVHVRPTSRISAECCAGRLQIGIARVSDTCRNLCCGRNLAFVNLHFIAHLFL